MTMSNIKSRIHDTQGELEHAGNGVKSSGLESELAYMRLHVLTSASMLRWIILWLAAQYQPQAFYHISGVFAVMWKKSFVITTSKRWHMESICAGLWQ